ncbi:MAG: cupin domain-containing protein [Planctomycetota bacterium]|jgi:cupin 2 domain-containing protein
MNRARSFFQGIPPKLPEALDKDLLAPDGLRIERIVSRGHSSPPDFWYDLDDNEWVILLSGAARLVFDDETESVELAPGDCLEIPALMRHHVDWTSADEDTVCLAVFYP